MTNQDMERANFEREYRRRQIIADDANEAVNGARDAYPTLTPGSTREALITWLCTVDRNGCWTDRDMVAEGWGPMTLDEAWEQVAMMTEDIRIDNHACADVTPEALATAFARELLEFLGAEMLSKVDRANAAHAHNGDHDICASANHCDSNMAMLSAYDALGLAAPDPACQRCADQVNEAWTIAKTRGFIAVVSSAQLAGDDLKQDLIQHATAVRDALQGLHEVWSFSLTEASDIMHDPSVNERYPFSRDLDEVVQMAGEWVEALKGGADGQ
tara:strand:- start:7548 stop:8363 length:816 start_codon:yes stop_codon:yes gene_type:complete